LQPKTAKIHRFVRFVSYCFITTVLVAFHFRSNFQLKMCNPMRCILFYYVSLWRILRVLSKNGFVMQNCRNLGNSGGEGDHFWRNPRKAHHWLIWRVLGHYACRFVHV